MQSVEWPAPTEPALSAPRTSCCPTGGSPCGPYEMSKLKILDQTPASLGYFFPPEWAPHRATWFSWPRPEGISFPGKYHTIPENLSRIICEIQSREQVHINVPNENWERIVREQLKQHGCPTKNVFFHFIK